MSNMTAAEVRKIRKALGFSQEELARFLWVTFSDAEPLGGRTCRSI